jgi:hypothetical protein
MSASRSHWRTFERNSTDGYSALVTTGGLLRRSFVVRAVRGVFDRRRLAKHECRVCRGWADAPVDTPWGRVCSDECAENLQDHYAW